MINFDDVTKKYIYIYIYNPNWPQTPDYSYRKLIIRGSGSGKTNSLFNLINHQPDIDKIYLYPKNPYETKYQFLIKKGESPGLKHFNDSKAFIEYSNDMDDIYRKIEECNPNKKRKVTKYYKKFNPLVTVLFIRCRKLNTFLVFIRQS